MEENLEEYSFEQLIEKLEEIAEKLEKGNLSLDDSVNLFENGTKVSKQCAKRLEEAEKKITILLSQGDEISEENFLPKE